jgi:hypothetical protein
MDEIIRLLKTPEECEQIARLFVDLSIQARRKAIDLRALSHGNMYEVETELLKAIYAYEEVLYDKNKKRTKASRTWQMVKRHGIIEAAQRAVNRPIDAPGYKILVERGLEDLTFEAIIVRFPKNFKKEVVEVSKRRLEELKGNAK